MPFNYTTLAAASLARHRRGCAGDGALSVRVRLAAVGQCGCASRSDGGLAWGGGRVERGPSAEDGWEGAGCVDGEGRFCLHVIGWIEKPILRRVFGCGFCP